MRITRNAAGPDQHKRDSYLYGSKETQPPVRVVHFKQHRRQHLMGVQQVVDVRSTVVAAGEAAAARDQGPAVGPAQHSHIAAREATGQSRRLHIIHVCCQHPHNQTRALPPAGMALTTLSSLCILSR